VPLVSTKLIIVQSTCKKRHFLEILEKIKNITKQQAGAAKEKAENPSVRAKRANRGLSCTSLESSFRNIAVQRERKKPSQNVAQVTALANKPPHHGAARREAEGI
jgi:hypothetical protein